MEGYSGKGAVCVTGGTGFVASWLIMRLLEQGYTVRTTVRSNPTVFSVQDEDNDGKSTRICC